MPLTEEEWRAFINEFNGAMYDVEADLGAALERVGLDLEVLTNRGAIPGLEAEALYESLRATLGGTQHRLNALIRRLNEMRLTGEL